MILDCIKSGNRASCATLLENRSAHEVARLLLQIGAAMNINQVTWAQSVFLNRSFLNKQRMDEIDAIRDRWRHVLTEIGIVAGEALTKKRPGHVENRGVWLGIG